MVKLVGPFISLAASGTFAGAIAFVCGTYARKQKNKELKGGSQAQIENRGKWKEGTEVWQSLGWRKINWDDFFEQVVNSGKCAKEIKTWMNGFQIFMMYYMDFGPGGWLNYPLPPRD